MNTSEALGIALTALRIEHVEALREIARRTERNARLHRNLTQYDLDNQNRANLLTDAIETLQSLKDAI